MSNETKLNNFIDNSLLQAHVWSLVVEYVNQQSEDRDVSIGDKALWEFRHFTLLFTDVICHYDEHIVYDGNNFNNKSAWAKFVGYLGENALRLHAWLGLHAYCSRFVCNRILRILIEPFCDCADVQRHSSEFDQTILTFILRWSRMEVGYQLKLIKSCFLKFEVIFLGTFHGNWRTIENFKLFKLLQFMKCSNYFRFSILNVKLFAFSRHSRCHNIFNPNLNFYAIFKTKNLKSDFHELIKCLRLFQIQKRIIVVNI